MGSGRVESEQKVLTISLIRSLSIALLGCMLVSSPLYGQSESALKQFFEGRIVVVKIDMPASHDGVNVYPKRAVSIDSREYISELKKYGTAFPRGRKVRITLIKTKSKHIEFQLDGGGWGTATSVYKARWPYVNKSRREVELERKIDNEEREMEQEIEKLERKIDNETNSGAKRRMEQELVKLERELDKQTYSSRTRGMVRLQRERWIRNNSSPEMKEKINAWEKAKSLERLAGGSRFNIRYDSRLTDGDKTPESVMTALSEYVEFPFTRR